MELLDAQGVAAERWHAEPFHEFEAQSFPENTTLWCADGSIVFKIAGRRVSMQPGDGIRFPAGYEFSADAGMSGCSIYEAVV